MRMPWRARGELQCFQASMDVFLASATHSAVVNSSFGPPSGFCFLLNLSLLSLSDLVRGVCARVWEGMIKTSSLKSLCES